MWVAEYSNNVNVRHPPGLVAKFTFPTEDGIHYLTSPANPGGKIIEANFGIIGTAPLNFVSVDRLTPPLKPNCSLYFQHKDDNMRTDGMRWWSLARVTLTLS